MAKYKKNLFELQNIFYADNHFALLIIFQGVDTTGKDGTIRHVLTSMNPMGVQVKDIIVPSIEKTYSNFFCIYLKQYRKSGLMKD